MDGIEEIAFEVINYAGEAKTLLMEAIAESEQNKFGSIDEKMKRANECLKRGEQAHFKVITEEARSQDVKVTMLLLHAEDLLISTETVRDLALQIIRINKRLAKLTEAVNH
jgi:Phosphotransferase system cellobiose-specific component IIA